MIVEGNDKGSGRTALVKTLAMSEGLMLGSLATSVEN